MNIGVPLHNHSEGSFLDGLASVEAIAKRVKEIGAEAFAITDHGECNQHLQAQRVADKYGLKFIPGMEGYLVESIEEVRENKSRENSHFCVYAENNVGLRNLWAMSSRAYMEGMYHKPLVNWEILAEYSEGLIVTDGCMLAYMARAILAGDNDRIEYLLGKYLSIFGKNNFFMELHTWQFVDPKTAEERKLNEDMSLINMGKVRIAKKYGIKLIVVNDSHYANECDWENHNLVWDMSIISDDDKTDRGQTAAWIMTDEENYYWMEKHGISHSVVEEALANTQEIADRCSARIEKRDHLPSLTGSREGDKKLFLDQVAAGFQKRVVEAGLDVEVYGARVEEEVDLILAKNFDGYFNVVADYVNYAKYTKKMLVGAGRGSGGGSLVNYLMGITSIDPIKYNLLFSRFLNSARVDMPDIDVDFPQSRRKEMTEEYLPMRYGKENVCLIGTLTRAQAKGMLKDLARAMKIPYTPANSMSALIDKAYLPQGVDAQEAWVLIKKQLISKPSEKEKPLDTWVKMYPELFQKMDEMIGLIRQSSTHAAGVLISDVPLLGEIPLRIKGGSAGMPITQFENSETKSGNDDVTQMGYIKFDFLGLRTLDTLQEVFDLVKERYGLPFDNANDYYDSFGDKEYQDGLTWLRVGEGDTIGVFQIETNNALAPTKRMKPLNEVDMADLTSVIRPGVVKAGLLTEYFDRKDGLKEYKSIHPMLDDILGRTYGIVVYQEQALKIFLQIANYDPADAEKMRKMIGKKLVEKMEAEKPNFIKRCLANEEFVRLTPKGVDPETVIHEMWNSIEATASYAFNEAHAIGYSFTASQCAYMKATYPEEYFTALLRTDPESIPDYVRWLKRMGYQILPPDINQSGQKFTLTSDGIRYGITAVKGVAEIAYRDIEANRPYASMEDFLAKVSKRGCNSRVVENLVSIGAFDAFGDRTAMMQEFQEIRKVKNKDIPDFSRESVVQDIELDLVGSYIISDPMDRFNEMIEQECVHSPEFFDTMEVKDTTYIGGQITKIKNHTTKRGDAMAWITLEWNNEKFEVVVFPRAYKQYKMFMQEKAPVICGVERLEKGVTLKELIRLDFL